MSKEYEPVSLEIDVYDSEENAEIVAESFAKLLDVLTIERLEAVADFVYENPDAVDRIEKLIISPPAVLKPIIKTFA